MLICTSFVPRRSAGSLQSQEPIPVALGTCGSLGTNPGCVPFESPLVQAGPPVKVGPNSTPGSDEKLPAPVGWLAWWLGSSLPDAGAPCRITFRQTPALHQDEQLLVSGAKKCREQGETSHVPPPFLKDTVRRAIRASKSAGGSDDGPTRSACHRVGWVWAHMRDAHTLPTTWYSFDQPRVLLVLNGGGCRGPCTARDHLRASRWFLGFGFRDRSCQAGSPTSFRWFLGFAVGSPLSR